MSRSDFSACWILKTNAFSVWTNDATKQGILSVHSRENRKFPQVVDCVDLGTGVHSAHRCCRFGTGAWFPAAAVGGDPAIQSDWPAQTAVLLYRFSQQWANIDKCRTCAKLS